MEKLQDRQNHVIKTPPPLRYIMPPSTPTCKWRHHCRTLCRHCPGSSSCCRWRSCARSASGPPATNPLPFKYNLPIVQCTNYMYTVAWLPYFIHWGVWVWNRISLLYQDSRIVFFNHAVFLFALLIFLKVMSGKPQFALRSSHSLAYSSPLLPQVGFFLQNQGSTVCEW